MRLLDPRVAEVMSTEAIMPRLAPSRLAAALWRWMRRDLRAVLSIGYLAMLLIVSIFAPVIAPYSPIEQNVAKLLMPPSAAHWLGTDDLGRDVLSRLIWGAPNSLYASMLAVSVAIALGVPIGLLIGFVGGWLDEIVSRFIDALLSFPPIVLAIAVTGALGIGLTNAMLSVGIVFAPVLARIVRAQTLVVKSALYVDAARGFGASTFAHHRPPHRAECDPAGDRAGDADAGDRASGRSEPELPGARRAAAAASWGGMLARAYNYIEIAPAQMYAPGFAILLTALAFNALGESMRVALDPTMKRR